MKQFCTIRPNQDLGIVDAVVRDRMCKHNLQKRQELEEIPWVVWVKVRLRCIFIIAVSVHVIFVFKGASVWDLIGVMTSNFFILLNVSMTITALG
jgi:protein-S-isoprenylcysteine O-methyltransferase Ste14